MKIFGSRCNGIIIYNKLSQTLSDNLCQLNCAIVSFVSYIIYLRFHKIGLRI